MKEQPETKQTSMNIRKDILNFCKEHKLNLSNWVNETFSEEFFGLQAKVKELDKTTIRMEELRQDIKRIKSAFDKEKQKLTPNEITFIKSVKAKQSKGQRYLTPNHGKIYGRGGNQQVRSPAPEYLQYQHES